MKNKITGGRHYHAAALLCGLFFVFSCASTGNVNSDSVTGIYTGVIPAADCPGISVVLILRDDGTYKMTYQYIERQDTLVVFTGNYTWDMKSSLVTMDSESMPSYYKAGKDNLTQLDMNGNEIKGYLAGNYVLRKL